MYENAPIAPSVSVARALVVASALACPGKPVDGQVPPVSCGVVCRRYSLARRVIQRKPTRMVWDPRKSGSLSYGGLAARGDSVLLL